jgi:DNA-binding NarL/FixJ family response regulator
VRDAKNKVVIDRMPDSQLPNQTASQTTTQPGRVLIVEDNVDTLAWLIACAQEAYSDAEIQTAESVAGGLALISDNHFDIALVDLGLPDGSGLQIIQALRTSTHVQPTYIVVATIYDDDKNLFAALKSGAQGYILKDHDKEKIVSYLQGVMRGITPLSSSVAKKIVEHFNAKGDSRQEISLAPREEDVLKSIAKGFSVGETASILGLTSNTVKGYVKAIYTKLGVTSRAEATVEAIRLGLVDLE